jgi:hypothetical protein
MFPFCKRCLTSGQVHEVLWRATFCRGKCAKL